ncbi:MAG TPA: TolC family protein, partial [Myxococcaceae bacterium]
LRAEELMVVARSRIERAQEGVAAAERRLAVGSATRSDLLRSQLELNTAREALLQLENQRFTAGLTLGRLVGIEGPVDPASSGPTEPTPLSVSGEALVESLVSAAPSVRAAEAAVAVAEAGVGVARSQYLPSVRLSACYDWFNDAPLPTGGRTSWSVRLGLAYPIFDGFQRDEGQLRARTQAEIAQSQLADTRRAVRTEAERVLSLLRLAEQRIEPGQIIASAISNVSGGTTLFTMADLSEMQVRAKIDETDIGKIQPAQAVRVTLEAYPARTFRGEVMKIEPQAVVEQNVTLFPVLIRMKNPEGLLKPGMNAEVAIEISNRQDVVTVPNTAVLGPREAPGVAALVGLDEAAVRSTLRAARPEAPQGQGGAEAAPSPECAQLLQRMNPDAGRGSLTDEEREKLRECRAAARGGGEAEGSSARGQGGQGGRRWGGGGGDPDRRPGVVFVQSPEGPQVRRVTLGLSDWEFTEVTSGLEAGEKVLLVTVAQLQQQQQQSLERMRQRAGGVIPGAGGGTGRGGGR